jgi:uncharacterized protein (DUF2342 family)
MKQDRALEYAVDTLLEQANKTALGVMADFTREAADTVHRVRENLAKVEAKLPEIKELADGEAVDALNVLLPLVEGLLGTEG